ncbi:MAG: sulfotransferase [Planctomycetota bacterium]
MTADPEINDLRQRLETVRQGLFFLVGAGRSGTTLLRTMLMGDPTIVVPHETRLYSVFETQGWRTKLDPKRDDDHARAIDMLWDNQARRIVACDRKTYGALAQIAERTWGGLFLAYVTACAMKAGGMRIGEKSPVHTPLVGIISKEHPEAKFIHLIRDPRAVVLSRVRAGFGSDLIIPNVDRWRSSAETALRQADRIGRERYMLLKYEQLAAEPRESIAAVCDFLGIEMTEAMLEHHKRREEGFPDKSREWMENTLKPVFTSSIDKWKQDMRPEHIAMIESSVGDLMERLGYELSNPDVSGVGTRVMLSRVAGMAESTRLVARRGVRFVRNGFKRMPVKQEEFEDDEDAQPEGESPGAGS